MKLKRKNSHLSTKTVPKATITVAATTALTAVFCLVLTSCNINEDDQQHTTATTPLTLTESITEEKPFIPEPEEEEEPAPKVILAVYDPFSDVPKPDDTVYQELSEAVVNIEDATTFLSANPTGFYEKSKYFTDYADTDDPLEKNEEFEYEFCPVNPEFASTEEELFDHIRGLISEDFLSDETIRNDLFAPSSYDGQPNYKTIDGVLCMKCQYSGVMTTIHTDKTAVLSYDEKEAVIAAYGTGTAYPPSHVFMTLKKSENGIWQLGEKYEFKDYYETEAQILYNIITLNAEKLNRILEGGNTPADPTVTESNGSIYTETDLDMTIPEMTDFFEDIFLTYTPDETNKDYAIVLDSSLLQKYLDKYIYDVYLEENGKLFRKSDAPRWYLPELELDPYADESGMHGGDNTKSVFGENGGGFLTWKQPFRNESGEIQYFKVTVCYKYAKDSYDYSHLYIGNALPILKHED